MEPRARDWRVHWQPRLGCLKGLAVYVEDETRAPALCWAGGRRAFVVSEICRRRLPLPEVTRRHAGQAALSRGFAITDS